MPAILRSRYAFLCTCAVIATTMGCTSLPWTGNKGKPMRYEVLRLQGPMTIDGNWDKPVWKEISPLELTNYMGKRPEHFPKTQAKLRYDDQAVYVIFRVEDQYVRAVAPHHDGVVCRDSCVEFFFAPGTDVSKGYFNLEMNCGGTMLFHFQVIPRKDSRPLKAEEIAAVQVAHSLPKIVNPEIKAPTVWTVEYRLPVSFLANYYPDAVLPAPGVTWKANFFKCADDTSHPHWLTWSLVEKPTPDFHIPKYFGEITFK
jgi:Carbohydrate-binding family 9